MSSSGRYKRKYRRCAECGAVRLAVEFKRAISPASARRSRCPDCGHVGPWWSFTEVERPEGEGGPLRGDPGAERA
jgi:DNA-directed RNA polymerase subunit RPC12/RpoP